MLRAFITNIGTAKARTAIVAMISLFVVVVVPGLALALAVVNAAALVAHLGLQACACLVGRAHRRRWQPRLGEHRPFVSIHLPICSEPPDLVVATLEALARLEYPCFEVIVLDNNTIDEALWRPVEAHCRRLGARFTFEHVESLPDAKAGALNRCLSSTDPKAELIAVVDADYQPSRDWLVRAVNSLGDAAYVQFPQAYRDTIGREGLEADYANYFETHMLLASRLEAPLLTGTLCVIRRSALEHVGGWSADTITEDAELGLRLVVAGLGGRYIHEVRGRGVMPTAMGALQSQRRRWVHGNAQTLSRVRWRTLARLGFRRSIAVVAQLTAWFNFLVVPISLVVLLSLRSRPDALQHATLVVASASIWLHVLGQFVLRWAAPRGVIAREAARGWHAMRAHLALSTVGAVAWLEPILGIHLGFYKTDKSGATHHADSDRVAVLIAIPLAAAALHARRGDLAGMMGAVAVAWIASSFQQFRTSFGRTAFEGARSKCRS